MKILLTGYEPFGGETINPALEAVKQLHGQTIGGAQVVSAQLPVVWDSVLPKLVAALEEHQPDVVISIGQA
ncbi:MAG TPA: pyroglutamyl-peptidase I, partial [Firmicutes bacterium]|nr:pyroglutamyl-peptidase I [Bacillota bacterium]